MSERIHNGCYACKYEGKSSGELPCVNCMHNYTDKWEPRTSADVVTCAECKRKYLKDMDMYCPYRMHPIRPGDSCIYGERE